MGQRSIAVIGLCVVQAGLLVTSGLIHLHLEQTAYQHVKTIGPLFIVQFVSCLVVAAALLVTRHILVALASVGLLGGTIVGFILVRTVGLFGFKLPYSTTCQSGTHRRGSRGGGRTAHRLGDVAAPAQLTPSPGCSIGSLKVSTSSR